MVSYKQQLDAAIKKSTQRELRHIRLCADLGDLTKQQWEMIENCLGCAFLAGMTFLWDDEKGSK